MDRQKNVDEDVFIIFLFFLFLFFISLLKIIFNYIQNRLTTDIIFELIVG